MNGKTNESPKVKIEFSECYQLKFVLIFFSIFFCGRTDIFWANSNLSSNPYKKCGNWKFSYLKLDINIFWCRWTVYYYSVCISPVNENLIFNLCTKRIYRMIEPNIIYYICARYCCRIHSDGDNKLKEWTKTGLQSIL